MSLRHTRAPMKPGSIGCPSAWRGVSISDGTEAKPYPWPSTEKPSRWM